LAVGGWREGWVVFEDLDDDGSIDAGETILRSQEPLANIGNFFAVGTNNVSAVSTGNSIRYDALGRAVGQQRRWFVRASGSFIDDARYTRTLCMNSVGRVRLLQGEVLC
jgi:type IV fimbrial biogenesis protein FimT